MAPAATTTEASAAAALAALPAGLRAQLEAAYSTPPRAYHSFDHVLEVLGHYDTVATGPGWMQPGEVLLAVLFHDAVYEAGKAGNEARSAELARAAIGQWLPERRLDADRVAALILATARHGKLAPGDVDREAALF